MNDPNADNQLVAVRLRVLQLIVAALIAGVLIFTVVVFFSEPANQPPPAAGPAPAAQTPILSYAAIAVFVGALLVSAIFSRLADKEVTKIANGTWIPPNQSPGAAAKPMSDTAKLLAVFTQKSIVAAALLEGPAFLACVAYMMERQKFSLGIVALAVVLMLIKFPTRRRVQGWLEKQLVYIDETRQFGGSSRS